MMIQVFLVDTGTMYHVDISINHLVSALKEEVWRMTRIPVDKQVMLVSGGVPLFPDKPLCHYEALSGNTIYLICKSNVSDLMKPPVSFHSYSDPDLTSQVESAVSLPAALETVRSRMHLSQRICEIDENELRELQQLVYDQHLQQQGWAAVVANLEDLVSGFKKRGCTFQKQFGEYMKTRDGILALLRRMPDVLILLGKVPVLPCLETLASRVSVSLRGPLDMVPSFTSGKLSLYNWMNAQDSKYKMEDVISDLTNGTSQMGEQLEEKVSQEIQDVIKYACGPWPFEMKSIKGLEERLYSLDKLTQNAVSTVEGQVNIKKGFKANWSRLEAVKDSSILPDLCASHRKQMLEMLTAHQKLLDLKKKCSDAKKELSDNLQHRLTWVMRTHHAINDMDNRLLLHHDLLNRIQVRSEFLRQVEQAPQVYASMVVEVVRRRLFSQDYMKWSRGVADESKKEHKREIHRRKSFTKQCGSHFLQKLFVGFKDNVPKFATEAPKDIDNQLPDITPSDIHNLAQSVPELQQQLRVPTGSGSPALASSFQQPLASDGGADPFMLEVTQSLVSSVASSAAQSVTSLSRPSTAQSGRGTPLAEGERLSLSYQGGEERQEALRPGSGENKDQLFLSLQDRFPVPQCLSETLTAEVNSAAMSTISVSVMSASPKVHELSCALEELGQQQQLQQEGGGDGVLLSSGDLEPTKSSDSDVISHESLSEHKPRAKRRGTKGLSDTSPDAETSQEFTTADFYIEDSMPSSITDSPPKQAAGAAKDRGEVSAVLAEKTKRVGELEGEVSALQSKLEVKLGGLRCVLDSDVASLRESLAALRDCVQHSDGKRTQAMAQARQSVMSVCAALVERVEREKEESLSREREGSKNAVALMEAKLQAKCQSMEDLQQGMLKVSHGIADLNKELQQQRESSTREMEALRERHRAEVKELTSKNLLEVELESDRVRSEMQQALDRQDAQTQALQQDLDEARGKIVTAQQEKDTATETLLQGFAKEREQLRESLESEKHQAVEHLRTSLLEQLKTETESSQREESERRHTERQKELQELDVVHKKSMQDREEELLAQHRAELDSVAADWSQQLVSQQVALQAEFDLKLQQTRQELEAATRRPEVNEQGVQTDARPIREQAVQSGASPQLCELHVQTDQQSVSEQGVQSDRCPEVSDVGIQNELRPDVSSLAVQSDLRPEVNECGVQSEARAEVSDMGVQNIILPEVSEQEVQSDPMPEMFEREVQSDPRPEVFEREVQSDPRPEVFEREVQSDPRPEVFEREVQSEGCAMSEQGVQSEEVAVVSKERHQELLAEAETVQALQEERQERERQLEDLRQQHQRDKEEALQNYKTSVLAERQIQFNEAISRAVQERDRVIDDLRAQVDKLASTGEPAGATGGEPSVEEDAQNIQKQVVGIKETLRQEKQELESEVALLRHEIRHYKEQLLSMTASAAPLPPPLAGDATAMADSVMEEDVTLPPNWEQEAILKDQKISELESKLMDTSMTTSMRKEARDKVSILTCNVGDLVLLCLDERHDQYVVFTVGSTLHFLHSECIDPLGLRSGEGELRKNWVLAEVTEREYCQARKAQNRFKVPVNTKFYRVKAKPWTPKGSSS